MNTLFSSVFVSYFASVVTEHISASSLISSDVKAPVPGNAFDTKVTGSATEIATSETATNSMMLSPKRTPTVPDLELGRVGHRNHAAYMGDSQLNIDDFREAYYWVRKNTKKDAKAMSTTEEASYKALRWHGVDYVLILFEGVIGNLGDDINKFQWMVRIAEGVFPNEANETNFFTPSGEYKVDHDATPTIKNSLTRCSTIALQNSLVARLSITSVRDLEQD
ncbi:oligosaccharyl transferase stt3 subunit, partial [Modicella reniformis]